MRRQGITLRGAHSDRAARATVNPLAPQSHRFDSARAAGALLAEAIDGLPIIDVCDPDYRAALAG